MLAAAVLLTACAKTTADALEECFATITIPEITPEQAVEKGKIRLNGIRVRKYNSSDDQQFTSAEASTIVLEFLSTNRSEEKGVPVRAEFYGGGCDAAFAGGYLKDNKLILYGPSYYQPLDLYMIENLNTQDTVMSADVENFANFSTRLNLYQTTYFVDLYEKQTYSKLVAATKEYRYTDDNGKEANISLYRAPENPFGIIAIATGEIMSQDGSDVFRSPMTEDGVIDLCGDYDFALGEAKWSKDKLEVTSYDDPAEKFEMTLNEFDTESNDEEPDCAAKLQSGIVGEAVLANGRKLTFKSGGKIVEWPDATWEKVEYAIVIQTHPRSTNTEMTIIDGYCYWLNTTRPLEDVGYVPTPDKGEKLISFRWYESD